MVWNAAPFFKSRVLLHVMKTNLASIFSNYISKLSLKKVNSEIWRHIQHSTHAPLSSVGNEDEGFRYTLMGHK